MVSLLPSRGPDNPRVFKNEEKHKTETSDWGSAQVSAPPYSWHVAHELTHGKNPKGPWNNESFHWQKKKSGSNREEKEGLSPYCPCLVSQLNCSHTLMQHSLEMWGVQGGWSLCDHWALSPTRHWSYLGRPEKPLQRRPWGHWFD